MMQWENYVVVVTGGASGLGLGVVEAVVEKGGRAVIFDLDEAKAEEVCERLGERVTRAHVNVTNEASVKAGIKHAIDTFGAIHACVNCAGIAPPQKILGRKGVMPLENFESVIQVNLVGTFNVMRLAAEQMANNEPYSTHGERGVIINTASVAAFEGQMGQIAYSASKAGVVGMSLPAARDLSSTGIRVNAIAPGLFRTPLAEGLGEKVVASLEETVEFPKRLGLPKEFAHLVTFLIENEYMNGEVVRLDGSIRMAAK